LKNALVNNMKTEPTLASEYEVTGVTTKTASVNNSEDTTNTAAGTTTSIAIGRLNHAYYSGVFILTLFVSCSI